MLVDLIENMYKQAECAVVINGKITDWFQVVTAWSETRMPTVTKPLQPISGICHERS